jgi:large subunit ribosomal protein L31
MRNRLSGIRVYGLTATKRLGHSKRIATYQLLILGNYIFKKSCPGMIFFVAQKVCVCYSPRVMKKDIHPENHRMVAFRDSQNGEIYLVKSAVDTEGTVKVDGKEYPLYEVEVSSSTHPFYTGDQKLMDTAGRAEKFRKRAKKAVADLPKKKRKNQKEETEETVETVIEVESGGKKIKGEAKKETEKINEKTEEGIENTTEEAIEDTVVSETNKEIKEEKSAEESSVVEESTQEDKAEEA